MNQQEFKEGRDYYFNEEGYMVLTELFLKERGYCCNMGCLHCPYKKTQTLPEEDFKNTPETSEGGLQNSD
jgi:hypothetical protein